LVGLSTCIGLVCYILFYRFGRRASFLGRPYSPYGRRGCGRHVPRGVDPFLNEILRLFSVSILCNLKGCAVFSVVGKMKYWSILSVAKQTTEHMRRNDAFLKPRQDFSSLNNEIQALRFIWNSITVGSLAGFASSSRGCPRFFFGFAFGVTSLIFERGSIYNVFLDNHCDCWFLVEVFAWIALIEIEFGWFYVNRR